MTEDNKEESVAETFISHLIELRDRIVRAGGAVLLVFICMFPWSNQIYDILAHPMIAALPVGSKMIATGVLTPFMVPLKVTLLAAFVVTLPWVLYQAWAFVAPGLYAHEKRLVAPLVVSSTVLFMAGIAFCYFFVFRVVFNVVLQYAPVSINVAPLAPGIAAHDVSTHVIVACSTRTWPANAPVGARISPVSKNRSGAPGMIVALPSAASVCASIGANASVGWLSGGPSGIAAEWRLHAVPVTTSSTTRNRLPIVDDGNSGDVPRASANC